MILLSNLDDEPSDRLDGRLIVNHVEHVEAVMKTGVPIPTWSPEVEWRSPDGDRDDYRIIELELV